MAHCISQSYKEFTKRPLYFLLWKGKEEKTEEYAFVVAKDDKDIAFVTGIQKYVDQVQEAVAVFRAMDNKNIPPRLMELCCEADGKQAKSGITWGSWPVKHQYQYQYQILQYQAAKTTRRIVNFLFAVIPTVTKEKRPGCDVGGRSFEKA